MFVVRVGELGRRGGGVIARGVPWFEASGDASGDVERSTPKGKYSPCGSYSSPGATWADLASTSASSD
jgi:hypothetical protein